MAYNLNGSYEIEGFERRRPNDRNDVVVISSDDDDDEYVNIGNGKTNEIKLEIDTEKQNNKFDPFSSLNPNETATFPKPNKVRRSPIVLNESTQTHQRFRTFAAKSTAAPRFAAFNQTVLARTPDKIEQYYATNRNEQSSTPIERVSPFERSTPIRDLVSETPESGFVDHSDEYESDFQHDFPSPTPTLTPVWSSRHEPKAIKPNVSQQPIKKLNVNSSTFNDSQMIDENYLFENQQQEQADVSSKCEQNMIFDTELIKSVVYDVLLKNIDTIKKQSNYQDSRNKPSGEKSSSFGSVSKSKNREKRSSEDRNSEKEFASNHNKKRKQIKEPERYSPMLNDDNEDNDEDLESTFSNDTEPIANVYRSPQYEPESDSDYENGNNDDNKDMESEDTSSTGSSEDGDDSDFEEMNQPLNNFKNQSDDDDYDNDVDDNSQRLKLRNTDKSLYFRSEKAKKCLLCNGYFRFMVAHIKSQHEKSEVFVSRISPKMVECIENDQRSYIKCERKNIRQLQTLCIFCEEEKNFPVHYWTDHIRHHTGEYGNYCAICNQRCSFANHCGSTTIKIDSFDLHHNDMHAYRCVECNFVQTHQKNMRDHLANQHQVLQIGKQNYHKFTLLPAFNRLTKQPTTNEELYHDSKQVAVGQGIESSLQSQPQIPVQSSSSRLNVQIQPGSQTLQTEKNTQNSRNARIQRLFKPIIDLNATDSLKDDPDAREMLANVNDEYEELKKLHKSNKSSYTVCVRPWFDEDYAKKRDINIITQFALYKCMHDWCIFATDSEKHWEIHMGRHISLMDVLSEKELMKPCHRAELIKFRECSYCRSEPHTKRHAAYQVCRHMDMEHRRNSFQCAFCFYRAIEMDNIIFHMQAHHSNADREILLYDVHREFQQKDEEILRGGCEQYITKIDCGQGDCKKAFVCFNALHSHQVVQHRLNTFQCPYCSEQIECKVNAMQLHFTQLHYDRHFEEFQCLYCEIGFNGIDEIRWHMSQNHPSKFLFVGARWKFNLPDDTADDIQIVYVGDSKDYSSYKLFTCSDFDALNAMDPKELGPNKQFHMQKVLLMQYPNIKTEYFERLPAISYAYTKKFADEFITFEKYQESVSSHANSPNQSVRLNDATHKPTQYLNMDPIKVYTSSMHHDSSFSMHLSGQSSHRADSSIDYMMPAKSKCSIGQEVSTNPIESKQFHIDTAATSIRYICITDKMFEDLSTINESINPSRSCHICFSSKNISNDDDLYAFVEHFIRNHPCNNFENMSNHQELLNHRLKFHKRQPLVCLRIEKSGDLSKYEILKFHYECPSCEARFQYNHQFDLHIFTIHGNVALRPEVVFESMLVHID